MIQSIKKDWKIVLWLWLAGLILRILHYWLFSNELIVGGDQVQYITLARRFASGDLYGVLHTYWSPVYPILIGIVSFFIDDLVLPALIVSLVAGSLAVPVTYFFVRQSYGQRAAVIAAIIAVFFPHLINSAVFDIGTESIYLLWIVGALLFGWRALQKSYVTDYVLTGVLLGLAYLTRPEAFAYPFYFAGLALIKNFIDKTTLSRNLLIRIGILLLSFTILIAPYIFYLHSETGRWTISSKAQANVAEGYFSQDDKTTAPAQSNSVGTILKVVLKDNMPYGLLEIHKNLPHLLPVFLIMIAGLGLFAKPWDRIRLEREVYLILFCLITFLGYAATVVQTRYFYILLPIFFGWIALGMIGLEHWFHYSIARRFSIKNIPFSSKKAFMVVCLLLIYFYVFPLNYFINKRNMGSEDRDAGLWIKEHSRPSPVIYSASYLPIFYAEGKPLKVDTTDKQQILEQIIQNQPDYVVTGERSLTRNPYLEGFTEILENSPDFELIYRQRENTKEEISIFRLKNRDSGTK